MNGLRIMCRGREFMVSLISSASMLAGLLFLGTAFFDANVFAMGPEYTSSRKWIEEQNPKDKTPVAERIFVNHAWKESAIVRFHKGMTLQDVLDKVKFRDRCVSIYRFGHKPAGEPVYNEPSPGKLDRKAIVVQPLDVIYLWNGNRN